MNTKDFTDYESFIGTYNTPGGVAKITIVKNGTIVADMIMTIGEKSMKVSPSDVAEHIRAGRMKRVY